MLDGYAMARKGQAKRALSLAFLSSMAGGVIGALGLTLAIPLARPLVLSFGSPELFMLTVLGVSLAAVLSRGNVVKGLVAGFGGLLLGMVGTAPTTAEERFTFGVVREAVQALIDAGEISPMPIDALVHVFFGALSAGATAIAGAGQQKKARAEVGEVVDRVLRGLREH